MNMIPILLAILVQSAEPPAPQPSGGKGGATGILEKQKIKVGDVEREFRLVVPDGLAAAAPVVFAFHGKGGSMDHFSAYSGFQDLALKEKFIAVFPQAIDRHWELRPGDGNSDLEFFDALLDHVARKYNVDRRRVYLTGLSMGGYFSNLLAAKRSEKIAAIAPHSGGLGVLSRTGINAPRKYAVLVIHGAADKVVPVEESRASRDLYTKEGHEVEYVEFKDLAHAWAREEDITRRIWKFFSGHPRK